MEIIYYYTKDREELNKVLPFEGNYYEDSDIIVDVLGVVDLNPPVDLEKGEEDTREPLWSDYLFNVIFKTDKCKQAFLVFESKTPKNPIRTFL